MGEKCKDCRSWEEEMFWNHFQCIHFSQFLRGGAFDRQLVIPEKFSRNLKKKLPEIVFLRGPSGVIWNVKVIMTDNMLFFTDGWQEFVKDQFLEENDLLIFKYNGESQFDVLMFDGQSMCEKSASYFVRKCGHREHGSGCQTKRKVMEGSAGIIHASSQDGAGAAQPEKPSNDDVDAIPVEQPVISPVTPKRIRKAVQTIRESSVEVICASTPHVAGGASTEKSINDDIDTIPFGQPVLSSATDAHIKEESVLVKPIRCKRTVRKNQVSQSAVEIKPKPDAICMLRYKNPAYSPIYISNRRPVTEDEKRNALQSAQETVTMGGFLVAMKPTHVYRRFYMAIPSSWITKHLSIEKKDVTLRIKEKTWRTRFNYQLARCSGGLATGWKNFAVDNNLEEFDVCVFEPETAMSNSNVVLDVSIFRVVPEVSALTPVRGRFCSKGLGES